MPDHKETGREPTERERETAFSPHQSPTRQADGDPGRKPRPRSEPEDAGESDRADTAERAQADGDAG